MAFSGSASAVDGHNPAALLLQKPVNGGKDRPVMAKALAQHPVGGAVCFPINLAVADGGISFGSVAGKIRFPVRQGKGKRSLPDHLSQQGKIPFKGIFAVRRLAGGKDEHAVEGVRRKLARP